MSTVNDYATFEQFVRATYPTKPFTSDVVIGLKAAAVYGAQKAVDEIRAAQPNRRFVEDFTVREVDGDVPELKVLTEAAEFYMKKGYSVVAMNPKFGSLRLKKDGIVYRGTASVGLDIGNRSTIIFTLEEANRS